MEGQLEQDSVLSGIIISIYVDSTIYPGNPWQYLPTLTVRKVFFLMLEQNFQYFSLCLLTLTLLPGTTRKHTAPPSLLSLMRLIGVPSTFLLAISTSCYTSDALVLCVSLCPFPGAQNWKQQSRYFSASLISIQSATSLY